jgi:hypothetical protein
MRSSSVSGQNGKLMTMSRIKIKSSQCQWMKWQVGENAKYQNKVVEVSLDEMAS